MQKGLWDQFGIQTAVPSKPFPSKALVSPCAANENSLDAHVTVPAKLAAAQLVLSALMLMGSVLPERSPDQHLAGAGAGVINIQKVPLYLKLNRLIYYS